MLFSVRNLELQMVLYFNVIFFPFWLVSIIFILNQKYGSLHDLYQLIITILLIVLVPTEVLRLYMGYAGNLLENIRELATFWMLSLVLQCPFQTFLFFILDDGNSPSQMAGKVIHAVMLAMLIMEIIFGFVAFKRTAEHRGAEFRLAQLRVKMMERLAEPDKDSES